MADGILYSSNGSALITVGSNLVNQTVTANLSVLRIIANGALGSATQVLTSNSTGGVYWANAGLQTGQPSFRAGLSANTSVSNNTFTKITFDTEVFDIGNYYNTSTGRWTPPAGPVLIELQAYQRVTSGTALFYVFIYKNGVTMHGAFDLRNSSDGGPSVRFIDNANGTDYYESYVLQIGSAATGYQVVFSALYTFFQGTSLNSNIQAGGLPKGYLWGLNLSTAGSSTTITTSSGEAVDSSGQWKMVLGSAYNKTTSAWALGSGNGGLDTGTISNNTWYHVYVIMRVDTLVVDVVFSTNATSPVLPSGYTVYRRIGSVMTNGSGQWRSFTQLDDEFLWDVPVTNVNGSTPGVTTNQTSTITTPLGIKTIAIVNVIGTAGAGLDGRIGLFSPDSTLGGSALTSVVGAYGSGIYTGTSSHQGLGQVRVRTNTSSQIKWGVVQASGTTVYISTVGWIDTRGRFS